MSDLRAKSDEKLVAEIRERLEPKNAPVVFDVCPSCGDVLHASRREDGSVVRSREKHECSPKQVKFLREYGRLAKNEYVYKCDCGDDYCRGFQVHRRSGLSQHYVGEVAEQERERELLREITRRFDALLAPEQEPSPVDQPKFIPASSIHDTPPSGYVLAYSLTVNENGDRLPCDPPCFVRAGAEVEDNRRDRSKER